MEIPYLELVTPDVDAVCATYAAALGVAFGDPVPELGNARTAELPGQGTIAIHLQGGLELGLWQR